jgi:putative transposase
MPYDSFKHHRRSTRLKGYDYTTPGAYFITIVAHGRLCIFGEIVGGVMSWNPCGQIISDYWSAIPAHFPNVQLDEFTVMPNHIHGIIMINDATDCRENVWARSPRPYETKPTHILIAPTLGQIMAYFKYQSTKHINQMHDTPGNRILQRNYHDHIIRNHGELQRIRKYIRNNPLRWNIDKENQ